jgi:nucleotide-binding universal stress UspA family protein
LTAVNARRRGWRMLLRPNHPRLEARMIKDVMVPLDGSPADELRLAAVRNIADIFDSQVIGLFLNPLPLVIPADAESVAAIQSANLIEKAREAGDILEKKLAAKLARLNHPTEIRRIDVLEDEIGRTASREARTADTFVAIRPNGSVDPEKMVEGVLFGAGRHIFLVPEDSAGQDRVFDRVLLAWNGSREAARAMTEAMPYLLKAKDVWVVVVGEGREPVEYEAVMGSEAVTHLNHHGIGAVLHPIVAEDDDVGAALMAEAERQRADLLVMGGYGHSRLREWLLGGVTNDLLHEAPVPLLVAH